MVLHIGTAQLHSRRLSLVLWQFLDCICDVLILSVSFELHDKRQESIRD